MSPTPPVFRVVVTEGVVSSKTMAAQVALFQRWLAEVVFGDDIAFRIDGNTIELTPCPKRAV